MSLETLQKVEPKAAEGVLATTLLSLSGPGVEAVPQEYKDLASQLLSEVRAYLKISEDDDSLRALSAIKEFLSNEIDRLLFSNIDREELRVDLGKEGALPISAYKMDFSDHFFSIVNEDKKFVRNAVLHADETQHLTAHFDKGEIGERGATLILKRVLSKDRKRENILLVQGIRKNDGMSVVRAWRVFPQIVDIAKAEQPLDVLRAFTDVYGLQMECEGCGKGTLVTDLELPKGVSGPQGTDGICTVHDDGRDYIATEIGAAYEKHTKKGLSARSKIVLAYAVDIKKYKSDLAVYG